MAALPTQYDPLFRRFAGKLPVAFLRALTQRESGFRPDLVMPGGSGSARGLMQVVGVVRQDWNKAHGTNLQPDDLLDPATSVELASGLINRIVGYYAKHPSRNLQMDWANPEFVKLLVAGWNAGYSEGGGVGKVATYLEARGIPVTHANVFAHAADAGATRFLSDPARQAWQASVADLFYQQPDWREGGGLLTWALAGFVAWGLYQILR